MKTKKIFERLGLNLSEAEEPSNGKGESDEFDGVVLFKTPKKQLLEELEDHREKNREERRELFKSIKDFFSGVEEHLVGVVEEKVKQTTRNLEALAVRIRELEEKVSQVERKSVDREMYRELKKDKEMLQEDFLFTHQKRAVNALIAIHDDLEQLENGYSDEFKRRVLQVLDHLGVDPIEREPEEYSADFQEAVDTIETEDEEKHLEVAEIVREGFKYMEERVVRPQKVVVLRETQNQEVQSE